jgi:hypothetical protein
MKNFMKLVACSLVFFASNAALAGKTDESLETLKSALKKFGEPKTQGTEKSGDKTVPGLYFGSKKINNNFDAVDNVKKKHGGTATIFVADGEEFTRITTNVLKDDGTRAVGTNLARNKAYDAIKKGEKFCGEIEILGAMYDTCYEAIKDTAGKTIGIYYVGFKK